METGLNTHTELLSLSILNLISLPVIFLAIKPTPFMGIVPNAKKYVFP